MENRLLHRLLHRQLNKHGINTAELPKHLQDFIEAINQSYLHFEDNRSLVERAMRLSSDELQEKNNLLRTQTSRQEQLIEKLKEAFASLVVDKKQLDDSDLTGIADQFKQAISIRKKLELDLIRAREVAEASLETRKIFLANISHEVRTPLNAIIGLSEMLFDSHLTEEQVEYLDAIKASGQGLLVIINDILDMTKLESGKFSLESIPFDLDALLKPLVRAMSVKCEQKKVKLILEKDVAVQTQLIGDPTRLTQVLSNLLSNAIKFTHEGYVKVTINKVDRVGDLQTIYFGVKDTGVGIDHSKILNIFEEFTQEDSSITRRYGGTGLGLTIAKNLVEMMGGKLEVQSEKNHGSLFSFQVRFRIAISSIREDLPLEVDKDLLQRTILLVEDNELNRLLAISLLKRWNAHVVVAVDGEEAIEAIKLHDPKLVLMDLQMPVLDGFQATYKIRNELQSTVPIIALTANALESEKEACVGAGMNDYISKPYQAEDLYLKIIKNLTA